MSIDRVRGELLHISDSKEPDELYYWTKQAPVELFVSSSEPLVVDGYTEVITWVANNSQFFQEAKDKFARGADGWLVAYAKAHNVTVVTEEVFNQDIKKGVPIPNVCRQFNVPYLNTFQMLRRLGVRFDLRPTP